MSAPFVLFLVALGIGCTAITGNPWYAVGAFFVIAAWVLANTWWKYRP